MKIRRCPLVFNNVISANLKCKVDDWYELAAEFRNRIIRSGLYVTGPVIYKYENFNNIDDDVNFTFYLPVNEPINMAKNDIFNFYKLWKIEDGLAIRHADLDEDIEEDNKILKACAIANKCKLQEPFYNIYLDVYGGGIIDIYAPIVEG